MATPSATLRAAGNGRSLQPSKSRPPRWTIWLPAGLTAGLLLVSAIAFVSLKHRIDGHRHELANVLEPTNRRLVQLQLAFEAEIALLRSHAALPRPEAIAQFWTVHRRGEQLIAELQTSAPRVGPHFAGEFALLQTMYASWRVTALAFASGALPLDAYRQRLPTQDGLARGVVTKTSQLEQMISRRIQRELSVMERLERRRLLILAQHLSAGVALRGTDRLVW